MGVFDRFKKKKNTGLKGEVRNENRDEENIRLQMMALGATGNQNSLDLFFDGEEHPLLPPDEEDLKWKADHPEEEEWKKRTFWLYNDRRIRSDSQLTESREFPRRGLGEGLLSLLEGGPDAEGDVSEEDLWEEEVKKETASGSMTGNKEPENNISVNNEPKNDEPAPGEGNPWDALTMYSQHGANSCGFVTSGFLIRDFLNKNKDLFEDNYLNRFALNGEEEGQAGKIPINDRTLAKLYGKIYGMKEEDDGVAFEPGSLEENDAVKKDQQLDADVLWKAIKKMTKGNANLEERYFQAETAEGLKEKTKPVLEQLLGQKKLVGLHALSHYAVVTGVSDEGITCLDSKGVDKDPDGTTSIGKNGFHQEETRQTTGDAVLVSWEEMTSDQISVLCLERSEKGRGEFKSIFGE